MPPVRTCVVTRERADPDALVRVFAGPDGVAHVDWHQKWKGRGAWLTCERKIFEEAMKKPAGLLRALDVPRLEVGGLLEEARAASAGAVADLLALTARAGAAVSGADALERTAPEALVGLVMASDASEASIAAIVACFPEVPRFALTMDREALGRRVGKGPRVAVGLRGSAPARSLLAELRRSHALG